jgi:hypothetical protein
MALFGELSLEQAMDLSRDGQILDFETILATIEVYLMMA